MFNCLNSHQTVLHSGCLILHSYQQIFFVPSPAILLSYVVDSSFIYNAIGDVLGLISAILLFDFILSPVLTSFVLLYFSLWLPS